MHKRKKILPFLIIFLAASILLFFISQKNTLDGFIGILQTLLRPIQRTTYSIIHVDDNSELTKIKNENRELRNQLVNIKSMQQDNQALRDQFAVTNQYPKKLIPAYIINIPSFLPGISYVDNIIIDKGSMDKIKSGQYVIFKDNLIGEVIKTSPQFSIVNLINHKDISFTAKTNETSAVGIISGTGEHNSILKNVLLSDTLKKGDTVITKNTPVFVVGKIISINKKASSLFQSAEIESLIDITKLKMVFVVLDN